MVDEEIMEACLKEVTKALTAADVNIAYVVQMKKNIVKSVNISELAAGLNAKKLLEKAVFREICRMLEGGELETKEKYAPKKGKPNVVMFVGLQVRQDDDVYQVRVPLPAEGVQASAGVRGYVPRGRVRSAETERDQGADSLLRILHRNGPPRRSRRMASTFQGGEERSHHRGHFGRHKQEDSPSRRCARCRRWSPDMTIFVMTQHRPGGVRPGKGVQGDRRHRFGDHHQARRTRQGRRRHPPSPPPSRPSSSSARASTSTSSKPSTPNPSSRGSSGSGTGPGSSIRSRMLSPRISNPSFSINSRRGSSRCASCTSSSPTFRRWGPCRR